MEKLKQKLKSLDCNGKKNGEEWKINQKFGVLLMTVAILAIFIGTGSDFVRRSEYEIYRSVLGIASIVTFCISGKNKLKNYELITGVIIDPYYIVHLRC